MYTSSRPSDIPPHWAIACGESRIIQVMGQGTPITITDAELPFDYFGQDTLAIAEHPDVPSWYSYLFLKPSTRHTPE